MSRYDFDYIIIGSGAAGSTAAINIAKTTKKRRIALIENDKWGGTTLNSRDVPYLVALNFSHLFEQSRRGIKLGLSTANLRYNYPTAKTWQKTAIKNAGGNNKKIFEDLGITCISSAAHFLSPHEIAINDKKYTGGKFLIATGSHPKISDITGLNETLYYTPNDLLNIKKLPKTAFIIGGGSTGCEIAQYLTELGVKVTIAEYQSRLLPKEDPEVGDLLGKYLEKRQKVKVLINTKVLAVEDAKKHKKITYKTSEDPEKTVTADLIFLAIGNEPNLDLGLENAGVKLKTPKKNIPNFIPTIKVDQTLQTTAHNIYAAGDVIGGESSTEKAAYEARVVVNNMVKGGRALVNYAGFSRVTNTFPEVSKVGLNEIECRALRRKYNKSLVSIQNLAIATTSNNQIGFLKLLTDKKGIILGATAFMPNASLVTQEIAFALRHGLNAKELAGTPHIANSWNDIVQQAVRALS